LKWKGAANLLGLHTQYELDRIGGRYRDLTQERTAPRTIFPLGAPKQFDLFAWIQRHTWMAPLVDAEYGSGTFVEVQGSAIFEVRVSTTGLLVRKVG
ncbi:MAG: multidrug transporter, partial [Gemmatimonadetes bacterium]|nr:multidrug transporter [Gemmatimonadota bacterium]